MFCAGTYKKILAHVAKPAQEKARIFKDTTVSEIHYGSAAEDKVRLRTTSGAVFEFDEVVSTTPLGWLKRNKAAFKPALPANLSRAIDAIGYGCLEKVSVAAVCVVVHTANTTSRYILASRKHFGVAKARSRIVSEALSNG